MKFAGVRGVKRVVKTVKLEEDFKSIITLRLGDRVMIKRKIVKELTDRCIESTYTKEAFKELEAEVGGFLAMVKGGREKVREGINLNKAKSLFNRFSVGTENL